MTVRQAVIAGGSLGLTVPALVLALLWRYGIWEIMLGDTDLRKMLWPSSVIMMVGWCCTVPGVLLTVLSIAINCLLYVAVALLLRAGIRLALPHRPAGR
jgi:hypothetical protein